MVTPLPQASSSTASAATSPGRRWGWALLVASCILLQPLGNSANLPMLVLAFLGIVQFVRKPAEIWRSPSMRALLLPFACLWLPMLVALPDAESPVRALQTTLVFLLFPFMGLAIQQALRDAGVVASMWLLLGSVLVFWSLDGLVQAFLGVNLFGWPHIGGQLTGVFHPKQTLGVVLAVLTPVFLYWLWKHTGRRPWLWLLAPLYASTILLSGKRSAWIMLAAAVLFLGLVWLARLPGRRRVATLALLGAVSLAGLGGVWQSPHFRAKAEATAGLASLDFERADKATSYRLTIWRVAADIYRDHWLNGIGPRAFRNVYPDYARAGDYFMRLNPESGPTHPHQIVVEIGVETGLIGLVGYGLLWVWLLREMARAHRARADHTLPWLISLAVALFPLNAGNALYDASFWGGITLWLLCVSVSLRTWARMERV